MCHNTRRYDHHLRCTIILFSLSYGILIPLKCYRCDYIIRFAQFFICPLFTPSATERELQAVDSEHAKNLQNDHWRQFQLYKALANPLHPFSKFGSGCLETLKTTPELKGIDVRKELLNFHDQYYSSNISQLVVLGKQPLSELQTMVDTCFALLSNKNLSAPNFYSFPRPYSPSELQKRVCVVPVNDSMRVIEISFPMREIDSLYLSKPTRYISHLVGHEGKGSILAFLKAKGWANELSAGENHSCSDWAAFTISIEVTDEGLQCADKVVEVVMAYINLVRERGPQKWIHDETATVASCQFQFLSKRPPIDYTSMLASSMHLYPAEHVLSGRYKIYKYDPEAIEECMSYLIPSNCLLMIFDKNFEGHTNMEEKWYGTNYSVQQIGQDLLDQWQVANAESELIQNQLHLPEPNELIATDFSLLEDSGEPKDYPLLWIDTDICRLW
jgi:insulysin